MHKSICDFIERLRRFIQGDPQATADLQLVESAHFIEHERARAPASDRDLDRFDTAVLARASIIFKGIRFDGPAVTALLNDLGGSRAVVVIKWDPSDFSRINVWNRAAHPHPCWVAVPIAEAALRESFSFRDLADIRDFARTQCLAFSTEEERLEAYERRRYWETVAAPRPSARTGKCCATSTRGAVRSTTTSTSPPMTPWPRSRTFPSQPTLLED